MTTLPTAPGFVDPNIPVVPFNNFSGPTVREADLIINGYPARTGRIMLGGAVNSDAGVTGQLTVDERNFDITRWPRSFQDLASGSAFRGAGQTFRLEAAPGTDFQRYTVQFADPNLLGYMPISMSVSGFLFDRRFDDWDEERLGGRLSFGYRITPDLSISAGISGQNVEISRPRVLGQPELDDVLGDNELWSGEVSLKHDTRDSPIQASKGHYFEFKYEQVFGDFDYPRFEIEHRKYWLLTQRADGSGKQTLSYSTQLGFSGDDTPIFENFFAGGYATLRGFDFRGASPVGATGVEIGGQFQWLNSLEYMFPITADDAFRGVAFVDFGTVEEDIELHSDNFRVAPGLGLRVAIPMLGPAPLAFDFAYPVAKADTDDERVFSFYMSLIR
jgi:outer membrane protein insertion porin family